MSKIIRGNDLSGRRFGKLTAIEPTPERKSGYTMWRCKCDCGEEILAQSRHLLRGTLLSCGCESSRSNSLAGQRFGNLVAIEPTGNTTKYGSMIWRCKCDCGNEAEIPRNQLLSGNNKSCGCLSRSPRKDWIGQTFGTLEVVSYAGRRKNLNYWHCKCTCGCGRELDVSQSALQSGHTKGCGSLNRNRTQDLVGQVFGDLTVISLIGKRKRHYYWQCKCKCGKEVEVRQDNLVSGHTQSCGCRVTGTTGRHFADGTCIEMIQSTTLFKNNTSGIRGVYWDQSNGKWCAQITFQGKTQYLGSFDDKAKAAQARAEAEKLFQDYLLSFQQKKEQNAASENRPSATEN